MTATERVCHGVIALASLLVPGHRRRAWTEEWRAEVWHALHGREGREGSVPGAAGRIRLVARCLGAFPHAVWIHGQEWNMNGMVQDVRFATRSLLKRPGFTLTAVLTLALGIGGNTAVFSVVNSVLLQPLPIENAERIVYTYGRSFPNGAVGASVSPPDFLDYRAGTTDVFETLAAQGSFLTTVVVEASDRPEELRGRAATADFLRVLGYEPAAGRTFTEQEEASDASAVVMITHGLWGRMSGYDPAPVGSVLRLDGEPGTVVGVLPAGLDYPDGVDLWFPLTFGAENFQSRAAHFLRPHGLLREGVTVDEAQASMDRVSARLEAAYPETNDGWYAQLLSIQEAFVGSARPALLVLLGGVGMVLLIACGNVANLLLARAATRRGEMAVRASLGASRVRLARQVVTESVVLAGLAGALGVGLAYAGVAALRRFEPGGLPRVDEVAVDGTALLFTLALSGGVGVLFGLAPAGGVGRGGLEDALGAAGRGRVGGSRRLRSALVAGEVAVSFVLLVGAGLLMRSFAELRAVDPGFDADGAVALPVSFPERSYPDLDAVDAVRDAIAERLAALPGVSAVGAASMLPLSGNGGDTYVYAEQRPPANARDVENTAQIRLVDDGYFDVMGVPMVAGRAFDAGDDRGAPDRVILNETLARDLFPDENPVGQRMVAWLDVERSLEVVGVAADVRQYSLRQEAWREFYLPARQRGARSLQFVVRGRGGTEPPAAALREAVWAAAPGQPVSRVVPLDSYLDGALAQSRFQAFLLGLFAVLALMLAAVGIYGVLAQAVADRRREIGVRMAMGAERGAVTAMVVRQRTTVALVGLLIGAAASLAATRVLRSMLFGVGAADPTTYLVTPAFLLTVVLLSSWLPARQAARTDPATVLRDEG